MWHKLTIMLFLFVLAQAANALPISEIFHDGASTPFSNTQSDHKLTLNFDNEDSDNLFNLPRVNTFSPSLFSTEVQTTPDYVLVIEFFKIKLTAGMFKHLVNPAIMLSWFEQLSHNNKSSRLSGWKDGNSLYSSRTTYHHYFI